MKCIKTLFLLFVLVFVAVHSRAQLWSGILKSTSGGSPCSFGQVASAGQCAIDWTAVGIPGGIPTSWTQSGSVIATTGGDMASTIQSALNSCGTNHYVQLGSGTFKINSNLQVKNNCFLNGNGPQNTIINCLATGGSCIHMGLVNDAPYKNGTCTVTAGNRAGSTSITVSAKGLDGNPCGVGVGGYLIISELNNPVYVTAASPQNPAPGCTYCDAFWNGTRLREQTVEMEAVSGSGPYTVTISPALYTDYGVATGTTPVYATPFGAVNGGTPDCKYCGLENLQIYANGTGLSSGMSDMNMTECAYCWVKNVEFNYTDADWLDMNFCYRCEVRDNYFANAFGHGAGGSDADVQVALETSASLIINNILERGHGHIIVDMGAAGNVIAYNYSTGAYDAVGYGVNLLDMVEHGAYPQFNLWEGNIGIAFQPDSWHGNNGYNTVFRNWFRGSNTIATYPQQTFSGITCSGGTCTINWTSGPSKFYAGQYVIIMGTNQPNCGSGTISTPKNWAEFQLTGATGSLSSTFSAGNCSTAGAGTAFTLDLAPVPAPIPHTPVTWTSTYTTFQGMWASSIPAFSVGNNWIGNVLGSSEQLAAVGSMYNSASQPCTSCLQAHTARPYSGTGFAITYNYDTAGDGSGSDWLNFPGGPSNTNGYWSNQGFTTTCYHQNYDSASASTIDNVNCSPTAALPSSFFLSSKPSWWGTVAWPAIGPDVSGGPDAATEGHANYIPAEVCYNNTARDGSGVKLFDAATCYGSAQQPPPPQSLQGVVH